MVNLFNRENMIIFMSWVVSYLNEYTSESLPPNVEQLANFGLIQQPLNPICAYFYGFHGNCKSVYTPNISDKIRAQK